MHAKPPDIDANTRRARRRAAVRAAAAGRLCVYRLDVFYSDIADVVQSAGGWLFDRVMAGWQINVKIGAEHDARPLQILGIRPHPLTDEAIAVHRTAIAVAAHVLDHDDGVHKEVAEALRSGVDEVTVWGDRSAAERKYKHRLHDVQHPLTAAAKAFKEQALIAAGASVDCLDQIEVFRASRGKPAPQSAASRQLWPSVRLVTDA
jgi:hypothetical protein